MNNITVGTLSHRGSRRALSLINDVIRGRKKAVILFIDQESGKLIESHTELNIEVRYREREQASRSNTPH